MRRGVLAGALLLLVWVWMSAVGEAAVMEKATFGGGCFWAMQSEFELLKGVESAVPGYAGGKLANPTYEAVCSGESGHAEVVNITFDPKVISYRDLVRVFLGAHDPTTLDRQGPDRGTNYRSVILTVNDGQAIIAREVIREVNKAKTYSSPIVTQVVPLAQFYKAEAYHQHYYAQHPNEPYTSSVVAEVARFKTKFHARLK